MPYNYYTLSNYSINYNSLFKLIRKSAKGKIFHSRLYTEKYLNEWYHILKKADQESLNIDISLDKNLFDQNFQFPITYNKQTIYIHFSVSELLNLLPQDYETQADFIPTEYFLPPYQKLLWNPIDNFNETIPLSTLPVIAVEYLHGYTDYLIIDGNTRLTKWTQTKKEIPTARISANSLVQNNLFPSKFDKLYYAFLYDMVSLADLRKSGDFSDTALLNISFLTTNTCGLQ